jgi:hypothetical protein
VEYEKRGSAVTCSEYRVVLLRLWDTYSFVKTAEDKVRSERLLFHWLSLGVTAFGYATRTNVNELIYFQFGNSEWGFTSNGNLFIHRFVEVATSDLWTPGLMKKIADQHERSMQALELAKSAGQTIGYTVGAFEFLFGLGKHPIPESDEDMLQQIIEADDGKEN